MNYAVIDNNRVINLIAAKDLTTAEAATSLTCVKYTDTNSPEIGWTYDGDKFIAPVVDVAE